MSASATLRPRSGPRLLRAALIVAMLAALAACTSSPEVAGPRAHVTVKQPAASLPGPAYAWVDLPGQRRAESDPRVTDAAFRNQLRQALDTVMAEKGYRLADDPAGADIILAYRVGVQDVENAALVSRGGQNAATPLAAIECKGGNCSQIVTRDADGVPLMKLKTSATIEGGLLVEVLEPRSVRVLWSAYNRGTVKQGAVTEARLVDVARTTLAQLPAR